MPARTADPNVQIAKRASEMFSGADVSQPQLKSVLTHVKRSMRAGILPSLKCSENQLRRYATSDISITDLPDTTREKLSAVKYSKPWPRKTAAILYQIHLSRKSRAKKTPTPASDTE